MASSTLSPQKPANNGKSDLGSQVRPVGHGSESYQNTVLLSPLRQKRIPEGQVFGEILVEACKAYPIHVFEGLGIEPRIAYADRNTHQENNVLSVKVLPSGGKTAPHPQIVLFINGPYHVETLGYQQSDPWKWTTWMELHLDFRGLEQLIEALMKAELKIKELVS
jgi:hypothetical protein